MYEENKVRFNWKGFLLKLLIVFLILFLVFKLLPLGTRKEANGHTKAFNDNFAKIKEVGNSYFTKDKLPTNDKEVKVTLRQLENSKKIKLLKGADKKVCQEDNSYIKSYKKSIGYELEVHLECGDEEDTSYIYLGCFDECKIKPTTTTTKKNTTTTKKSSSSNSSSKSNSSSSANNTTRKTTTTTTTRVQKYAVIFNENGGSKVKTQNIEKGKTAIKPSNPTKNGYTFEGWYLDGREYNFNTPVNSNIILIAKWKPNDLVGSVSKSTYNQTVYGVVTADKNKSSVNTKAVLNIPTVLKDKTNVKIKSVSYIRNINSQTDISNYINNKITTYNYDEGVVKNNYTTNNFGIVDSIELRTYPELSNRAIYWNGIVKSSCNTLVENTCTYGIVYRVTWEYIA